LQPKINVEKLVVLSQNPVVIVQTIKHEVSLIHQSTADRVVNIEYYRPYFLSINIGIADTIVAMYQFEYQRYFLMLSNVDTFTDTFSFQFAWHGVFLFFAFQFADVY
jgi:hypothetical protein